MRNRKTLLPGKLVTIVCKAKGKIHLLYIWKVLQCSEPFLCMHLTVIYLHMCVQLWLAFCGRLISD